MLLLLLLLMMLMMMIRMMMMCKVSTLFSRGLLSQLLDDSDLSMEMSVLWEETYLTLLDIITNHIVHLSPMIKLSPVYKYIRIGSFEFSPSYPRGQEFYQV
jgi:hypothetical protein